MNYLRAYYLKIDRSEQVARFEERFLSLQEEAVGASALARRIFPFSAFFW